jgi:signal transduction histidine kinase
LVHELRTPLNAIRGFGEMIEGQFLGPVATGYRDRARAIVHDSGALLNVFEDLDANARLETGDYPIAPDAQVDMTEVVRAVAMLHADLVDERGIRLRIALPAREGLMTALDRASALRMVDRLLGAALSATTPGDLVELSLQVAPGQLVLAVSNIVGVLGEETLDGFAPLGRDFALRLATRLAERAGGRLEQSVDSFRLILPAMKDSARANGERT